MQARGCGTSARIDWSSTMARGVVVVYFSRLGGRLRGDQKIMLDADAQLIAKLKGYDFRGHYEAAHDYSASIFFVPDDVLVREEASALGVRGPNDVYGGVVPHPFVKTKAITHQLIDSDAQRPRGPQRLPRRSTT